MIVVSLFSSMASPVNRDALLGRLDKKMRKPNGYDTEPQTSFEGRTSGLENLIN